MVCKHLKLRRITATSRDVERSPMATTVTPRTMRRWLPDRPEVTGGLPRQWRNLFHTITRPILRAYPPESKNSRPSLASRSVAGGGSVYGEVASSVPIIAGVISTEKTTAMESSAMKASTMKTTAPETSAVGLGSSNADQRGEGDSDDGCHHPQFVGHRN